MLAIPQLITDAAKRIRNAIYGEEVQESLARGLEVGGEIADESNQRSKELGKQFQELLDTTTDEDYNSAPEIRAARNGKNNLKQRLDEEHQQVTAQLAHTGAEVIDLSARTSGFIHIDQFPMLIPEVDDTHRIRRAIAYAIEFNKLLFLNGTTYFTSEELVVSQPVNIKSLGVRIPFHIGFSNTTGMAEIRKTTPDVNGVPSAVMRLTKEASGSIIESILFTAALEENILYTDARLTEVADSNNSSYGILLNQNRNTALINCGARQAKKVGIYVQDGSVVEVTNCVTANNFVGHIHEATDSQIMIPLYHHNIEQGGIIAGHFTKVLLGRTEWNGKHGLKVTSAENQILGVTIDRNGFSGLFLDGAWGHTVTGCNFVRNAAGGDGTVGRWAFSVPGHDSYIEVPEIEKGHVRLNYQRDVTLSGNRYRAGRDDANTGSFSPKYVYTGSNVQNSSAVGNAGEHQNVGGSGGCTSAVVEYLTNESQRSLFIQKGTQQAELERKYKSTGSSVGTLTIPLDDSWQGKITVFGGAFQNKQLFSEINVLKDASGAFKLIEITNKGNVIATATFVGNSLSIGLSESVFARYVLERFVN